MEPEDSLYCPRESTIGRDPEPHASRPHLTAVLL